VSPLHPIGSDPIAIRRALEEGWQAFCRHAAVLTGFTVLVGGLHVLAWVAYRGSGGLLEGGQPQPAPEQLGLAIAALGVYLFSGCWLVVGLVQGAELALEGGHPKLGPLLRLDGLALARLAWTSLFLLLLLALVLQVGEVSSWLLTWLIPGLAPLPTWAARALIVYAVADQVLVVPITVLGQQAGLAAFRSGRRATDPHWLYALGLTAVVALILLAGFLLLIGLVAALPIAFCTLTAAYRQLFVIPVGPRAVGAPRTPA